MPSYGSCIIDPQHSAVTLNFFAQIKDCAAGRSAPQIPVVLFDRIFGLGFFLRVVQHGIRNDQAFDRLAAYNVRIDDFVDICGSHAAVPNGVGIHHDRGADFTLLQASGFICAHFLA